MLPTTQNLSPCLQKTHRNRTLSKEMETTAKFVFLLFPHFENIALYLILQTKRAAKFVQAYSSICVKPLINNILLQT